MFGLSKKEREAKMTAMFNAGLEAGVRLMAVESKDALWALPAERPRKGVLTQCIEDTRVKCIESLNSRWAEQRARKAINNNR